MSLKSRGEQSSRDVFTKKWTLLLCIGSFCAGMLFTTRTLDKTISNLEMELAAARATQESILSGSPLSEELKDTESSGKRRYFMVVGINTAFSSRKRRDSVRATWMPQGERRKKMEEEKGVIIRFVIGHSATVGGILDRAIQAEDKKHGDLLRLVMLHLFNSLSTSIVASFAAQMLTVRIVHLVSVAIM